MLQDSDNIPETYIDHNGDEVVVEPEQLEATFDYLSIHAVITTPNIKHKAYGLPYSEYRKYRVRTTDTDADAKNSKICFYTDPVLGTLIKTLARRRDISLYAYINDMLEEGQIHFHPEYHEQYEEITRMVDDMNARMNSDAQSRAILTLNNQRIGFNVCMRGNPRFVPRVAYWLCEDIKTTAMDLNMTVSDVAYVYIVTGIIAADVPEMPISKYQDKILSGVLDLFNENLNRSLDICNHIYSTFDNYSI